MLDLERRKNTVHVTKSVCVNIKMPVDFASYLLSSSPPGFDLHYQLRSSFGLDQDGEENRHNTSRLRLKSIMITAEEANQKLREDDECTDLLFPSQELSELQINDIEIVVHEKCKSPKKKVTFADEAGLNMCDVKIINESPDTPPQFSAEVLSAITKGASAAVTDAQPLSLNFSQPVSDYVLFREKIATKNVSLENVILKDYDILGTVKVKNIVFDKKVTVKCTFDSWETSQDIPASYVPQGSGDTGYDTFSFQMKVPPNYNIHKKIQFCICYDIGTDAFWDNNDGKNYEVVSSEWKEVTELEKVKKVKSDVEPAVFDTEFHESWTQYSSWSESDNSVPYY